MALARKLATNIFEVKAHAQKVTCLDLGETGRVLVTGGQDRNVKLWAFGNKTCFMSLTGHNGVVDCVKFAYNDDYVYSADDIGIIRKWDLNGQSECREFYGHMKSVRTLDFHPYGEYVVSGSKDSTVRLWDIRNNSCIKNYRGHISNVNSVKFSPDGSWIASAGTEGSIIIWDIRSSKQIIEFEEAGASPVQCIQFHPFEFLLAAGRNDGTVDVYDLESKKVISRTDDKYLFHGHTIKCITFSDNGNCLFVGTANGVSVIGWEPDREFDHIQSTWHMLGDMKIVNNQLFCGSFEDEEVAIHTLSIDQVFPFYNPSNAPTPFNSSQSSRKSFSRGNQKLRLSIGHKKPSVDLNSVTQSYGDGMSSPNLSIELIDEADETILADQDSARNFQLDSTLIAENGFQFEKFIETKKNSVDFYSDKPASGNSKFNKVMEPMSLQPDLEYYNSQMNSMNMNSDPDLTFRCTPHYDMEPEREDFPVNSAQPPDYALKREPTQAQPKPTVKQKKANSTFYRSTTTNTQISTGTVSTKVNNLRKSSNMTYSVSSNDLTKLDDSNFPARKQRSRGGSPVRNYPSVSSTTSNANKPRRNGQYQTNKENNIRNKNIVVEFITKPPSRSKTSIDLRSAPILSPTSSAIPAPIPNHQHRVASNYASDDSNELSILTDYHDRVYQELSNRYRTLQVIRNSTRANDIVGALRQALKMNDHSVFVDILGSILEKTTVWNLDMCVFLLPVIYELLQSDQKFHYTRACDALRVILSNFLPIIRANTDPWGPARSLGVDITREERANKCMECRQWLLKIKHLSNNQQMGSTLIQLQNLIVDL